MSADRLLELLALLPPAAVAGIGLARALALARRGVRVLPVDRERSLPQALLDLAFALGLLAWVWEVLATVLAPGWRLVPAALAGTALPWPGLRWPGLALAAGGVVLYARALRDFGLSWRFTIDREHPGTLVTTGVFAFTRNPVYLALVLVGLGTSLALDRVPLLLLSAAAPLYLDRLVRREERFLVAHYGERYAAYCAEVPRWLGRPHRARRRAP